MMIERTYNFRIYPNKEQAELMKRIICGCQKVWNMCVEKYNKENAEYSKEELKSEISKGKELASLPTLVPLLCVRQLFSLALRNPRCKAPKAKKITDKGSFTIFTKYIPSNGTLHIFPIGPLKLSDGYEILQGGIMKSVVITLSGSVEDVWSAAITITREQEAPSYKRDRKRSIGLDYSASRFYVDSDGRSPDRPAMYRELEDKIAAAQSKLSRMVKGSSNYLKQKDKLSKLQRKAKNRRHDFLHKLSSQLVNDYDYICVESLSMEAMKENNKLHLGKSTTDNSWYEFVHMLEYKSKEKGKKLIKISKYFPSSKICSTCGHPLQNININTREWTCPHCSAHLNRDHNAALNILHEGLKAAY